MPKYFVSYRLQHMDDTPVIYDNTSIELTKPVTSMEDIMFFEDAIRTLRAPEAEYVKVLSWKRFEDA